MLAMTSVPNFVKVILRYKKIGYNINVIRQTACMVVNPIMVNNFASLFNCMPAGLDLRFHDCSSVKAYWKFNFG